MRNISEAWRVIAVRGPEDPVWRPAFSTQDKAEAEERYYSTAESWPAAGAVYLSNPEGRRVKAHDPTGNWIPSPVAGAKP